MIPMQDDIIQYEFATATIAASWQPVSLSAAKPYLKAIGLVTTMLFVWAGLCAI